MPTLRSLLAAPAPLLVLDAASTRVQAGLLAAPDARWASSDAESGVGLFDCLQRLGCDPGSVGAFIYCDGPGSTLGIRTAAMAIRTWCVLRPRPVYAYHSLSVLAHALAGRNLTLIADARRDSWHVCAPDTPLRRVPTAGLTGELAMPETFRHWTPLPTGALKVPYDLAEIFPHLADADLFRATDSPDAFLHEEPSYATWTPQVHRAPAKS